MGKPRRRANSEGSIFPYRNGYAAYAWVTTPNGTRRRKYVYGKTREIVHDKWIKLQQQAAQGPITTSTLLVGPYLHYWLYEIVKPNLAPKTFDNYERFVRLYIAPHLASKNLTRLTTRQGQLWMNEIAITCQCCEQNKDARRSRKKQRCCAIGKCCDQRLSPRTLKDIRDCLRAAFNCASAEELISRNVAKFIKVPAVRKKKRKRWTTEQARQFLASAKADNDPLYAAYVLILVLALRKGETLGLPDTAADFERQLLDISYQLQRVGRKLLHRQTKTEGSDADLPFPAIAGTALRLIHATSTALGTPESPKQASPRSPCTTADAPVAHYWPTSTCIPALPWRSFGTRSSTSRWRSTPKSPMKPLGRASRSSAKVLNDRLLLYFAAVLSGKALSRSPEKGL